MCITEVSPCHARELRFCAIDEEESLKNLNKGLPGNNACFRQNILTALVIMSWSEINPEAGRPLCSSELKMQMGCQCLFIPVLSSSAPRWGPACMQICTGCQYIKMFSSTTEWDWELVWWPRAQCLGYVKWTQKAQAFPGAHLFSPYLRDYLFPDTCSKCLKGELSWAVHSVSSLLDRPAPSNTKSRPFFMFTSGHDSAPHRRSSCTMNYAIYPTRNSQQKLPEENGQCMLSLLSLGPLQPVPRAQPSFPLSWLQLWEFFYIVLSRISIDHQDESHLSFLAGDPCPLGCQYYLGWLPHHHNPLVWIAGMCGTSSDHRLTYSWLLSSTWVSWDQVHLRHNSKLWVMRQSGILKILKVLQTSSSLWSISM